jgi:hypothetical protein
VQNSEGRPNNEYRTGILNFEVGLPVFLVAYSKNIRAPVCWSGTNNGSSLHSKSFVQYSLSPDILDIHNKNNRFLIAEDHYPHSADAVLKEALVGLYIFRRIGLYGKDHIARQETGFITRGTRHYIYYPDLSIQQVNAQPGIGIIKALIKMAVGLDVDALFGIIQHHIKPAKNIIAYQTA